MYCSYHQSNPARVGCSHCRRPLCSYCDHRIKGYPYCQDCIVRGIDSLSRSSAENQSTHKGIIAALLGMIPGLGAAYNHQNVKAIFHFIGTMLLFQFSEIRQLDVFFALAGTAFYFYTIVDAYRTGKRIGAGEDPAIEESRLKRFLARHVRQLGLLLLAGGTVLFLEWLHPFGFSLPLLRLLPAALILLGGYLIISHIQRSNEEKESVVSTPKTPYALFPVQQESEKFRRYAGGGSGPVDRFDDRR
jgi:TM2 domain-containing membrane protein YozV